MLRSRSAAHSVVVDKLHSSFTMLSRSYLGRHIWQNVWADTVACQKLGTRLAGSSAFEDQSASDLEIKDMAPYDKIDWVQTMIVRKKGHDVLADPIFNKGTAFSHTERERLGIRGLLPPKVSNLTEQKKNILRDYREGLDYVGPEDLENWSISRCSLLSSYLYLSRKPSYSMDKATNHSLDCAL